MESADSGLGYRFADLLGSDMGRLSAVFFALCMALIAGSAGIIAYLSFAFTGVEAAVIAIAVMTALVMINTVTSRQRDRYDIGAQIADLSRGTADIARQLSELDRRLVAMENEVATVAHRAHAATAPLAAEIGELGGLLKDVADAVAAHEQMLESAIANATPPRFSVSPPPAPAARTIPAPAYAPRPTAAEPAEPDDQIDPIAPEGVPDSGPFRGLDPAEIVTRLARAIEANRIDLFLQPIVTLPQRKVRYYEALARLRHDDGALLAPDDFLPHAETGGLVPEIDNLMVFRCVQVVRRLSSKNREVGLFCNMSPLTLADAKVFKELTDFLEANRALAPYLVFEFAQSAVRAMGPIEEECIASLADLGFRFSMDHVADLRMEPRELAERGFRFIKVPATLLLSRSGTQGDIHPADFSDLLGRYGIDLIAEKIESEGTVVDLLDYDVRFGQGFLFSPPRPVRTEVLQGIADRPAPPARAPERPAPPAPAAAEAPAAPAEPRPSARTTAIAQLARGIAARRAQG
jgi:cyclic-di-GMP phosphodiesterase TipF (flagellum assembly factor)